MRSLLERSNTGALWSAFRHVSGCLLERSKPAKARIISLMSITVAVVCAPPPVHAQITYNYIGSPFSIAQCSANYSSTVCVNGNVQATITFDNIPQNYTGTVIIGCSDNTVA
jgi:hypothetical protein